MTLATNWSLVALLPEETETKSWDKPSFSQNLGDPVTHNLIALLFSSLSNFYKGDIATVYRF
jgi:hypothetical protein